MPPFTPNMICQTGEFREGKQRCALSWLYELSGRRLPAWREWVSVLREVVGLEFEQAVTDWNDRATKAQVAAALNEVVRRMKR